MYNMCALRATSIWYMYIVCSGGCTAAQGSQPGKWSEVEYYSQQSASATTVRGQKFTFKQHKTTDWRKKQPTVASTYHTCMCVLDQCTTCISSQWDIWGNSRRLYFVSVGAAPEIKVWIGNSKWQLENSAGGTHREASGLGLRLLLRYNDTFSYGLSHTVGHGWGAAWSPARAGGSAEHQHSCRRRAWWHTGTHAYQVIIFINNTHVPFTMFSKSCMKLRRLLKVWKRLWGRGVRVNHKLLLEVQQRPLVWSSWSPLCPLIERIQRLQANR